MKFEAAKAVFEMLHARNPTGFVGAVMLRSGQTLFAVLMPPTKSSLPMILDDGQVSEVRLKDVAGIGVLP